MQFGVSAANRKLPVQTIKSPSQAPTRTTRHDPPSHWPSILFAEYCQTLVRLIEPEANEDSLVLLSSLLKFNTTIGSMK